MGEEREELYIGGYELEWTIIGLNEAEEEQRGRAMKSEEGSATQHLSTTWPPVFSCPRTDHYVR